MKTYEAKDIRNVLLVGHGGAGKTTLLEAMQFASGATTRMGTVEDGNTVSDFEPEEIKKGISVSLGMAPVEWSGVKVNVLDAPGYADFIGDVRTAIQAVDAVVLVVSAVDGVEVQTEVAWELAIEAGLPRAILINKLDRERASFERTLEQLVQAFGTQVAPLDGKGHIDLDAWKKLRERCRVRRFWPNEPEEVGHIVHKRGNMWAFHYDIHGDPSHDETGFRFDSHAFVPGEYVSIKEQDGVLRTFRVVSVREVD